MPKMRYLSLTLVAMFAACSGPSDSTNDSAAAWHVDSIPLLTLGIDESDSLLSFGHVAGATRLESGEVIVADRPSFSILTYAPDGSWLRSFGRKGSGPGEIRYLASMSRCGDSLYINDIGKRAHLVYSIGGDFGRAISFAAPDAGQLPYRSACNAAGIFVHNGWGSEEREGPGRRRGLVPYWLTGTDGEVSAKIGDFPGSERLVTEGGSMPHPLGKEPVIAIGRDRVYIGTADSLTILVFALDGTPLSPVAKANVSLAVTPDDITRYKLLDTLGMSDREQDYRMREWQTFEFPPTVPAYTALLVDVADNLWVRLFSRGTSETVRWLVFSPDGSEIGSVDLPMEMTVHEIGIDYVLGSGMDLVEATPRVWVYKLHR